MKKSKQNTCVVILQWQLEQTFGGADVCDRPGDAVALPVRRQRRQGAESERAQGDVHRERYQGAALAAPGRNRRRQSRRHRLARRRPHLVF